MTQAFVISVADLDSAKGLFASNEIAALKEPCHNIFVIWFFFHNSTSSEPLTPGLKG
jgi:hypothetical protein